MIVGTPCGVAWYDEERDTEHFCGRDFNHPRDEDGYLIHGCALCGEELYADD